MASHSLLAKAVCLMGLLRGAAAIVGIDFEYETVKEAPRALMLSRAFPSGLTQMTFCVWMKVKAEDNYRDINPVSYASREADATNEILLEVNFEEGLTSLYINDEQKVIKALPPSDQWVHVCASWENSQGRVDFYFDGENVGHTEGTKPGHLIGGGGYMVLGQDQDWYDGGYSESNAVVGRLTQLHVWDRALTLQEIRSARDCKLQGNVINWEVTSWRLAGNIAVVPTTAPCFASPASSLDPCPVPEAGSGVVPFPAESATATASPDESNEAGSSASPSGCTDGSGEVGDEHPCAGQEEFNLSYCGTQRDPLAFDLVYYDDEDHSFARLHQPALPGLSDLSFGFWVQPRKEDGPITPFSYSAASSPNVAMAIDVTEGTTVITLGAKQGTIPAAPPLGAWTHIFLQWSGSRTGLAELYFNGTCVGRVKRLNRGYVTGKGGRLLLGQKQEEGSESLEKSSKMLGRLTDFHMWDHVMTNGQIAAVARCNSALVGNVLNWNSASWRYQGYVTYESSTLTCQQVMFLAS